MLSPLLCLVAGMRSFCLHCCCLGDLAGGYRAEAAIVNYYGPGVCVLVVDPYSCVQTVMMPAGLCSPWSLDQWPQEVHGTPTLRVRYRAWSPLFRKTRLLFFNQVHDRLPTYHESPLMQCERTDCTCNILKFSSFCMIDFLVNNLASHPNQSQAPAIDNSPSHGAPFEESYPGSKPYS